MSQPVISIRGIGKKYKLGATLSHNTLRDRISHGAKSFCRFLHPNRNGRMGGGRAAGDEFWALRNVNFNVRQGEVVGLIGKNGAGKSTLLKILGQITAPTEGEIRIRGRVASLLEVGTGFHGELSGRENIFLNGAILGMTRAEIKRKFDDIVAFAEIEKFINTPVKRYSSGMFVRLAFAVAAQLEPDILLVDEVLAVGDVEFQKKCLGKMGNIAKQGRTVLFVSHSMPSILKLCNKAIFLDGGTVRENGRVETVVQSYLADSRYETSEKSISDIITELPKDPRYRILNVNVTQDDRQTTLIRNGSPFNVAVEYEVTETVCGFRVLFDIRDEHGTVLIRSFHDDQEGHQSKVAPGRYLSIATVPAELLAPKPYLLFIHCGPYPSGMLSGEGVPISLAVEATSSINTAYQDPIISILQPRIGWETA